MPSGSGEKFRLPAGFFRLPNIQENLVNTQANYINSFQPQYSGVKDNGSGKMRCSNIAPIQYLNGVAGASAVNNNMSDVVLRARSIDRRSRQNGRL